MYVDHCNAKVAFPTMIHPVIDNLFTKPNSYSPISKSLTDRKQNQHPLYQNQTLVLAVWEVCGSNILQKAYQAKQMTYLKAVEEQARLIIRKQGGKSRVAGIFQ